MPLSPAPSLDRPATVSVAPVAPEDATLGRFVRSTGLGDLAPLSAAELAGHGFTAKPAQVITLWSGEGRATVVAGVGERPTLADVRDAAAAIARASGRQARLSLEVPSVSDATAAQVVEVLVEGALLARYSYDALREEPQRVPITELVLVTEAAGAEDGSWRRSPR